MTPQEASDRFEKLKVLFAEDIPRLINISSADMVQDIKDRITTKGENKYGGKMKYPYSKGYERFKSGLVKPRKGTKKENINTVNKLNPFRDLTFSGSMMGNFKAFKEGGLDYIGFPDPDELKKAEGNSWGNGKWSGLNYNIIEPSEKEIEQLTIDFNKELDKLIKQIFP